MSIQAWQVRVTVETGPDDLRDMREWLDEYAAPVPSRNADVLTKFVSAILNSTAQYDGVYCRFDVKRAIEPFVDVRPGYQMEAIGDGLLTPQPQRRLIRLAIGSFGLLVMLALFVTAGVRMSRHGPLPPTLCYNPSHATDTMHTPV